MDPVVLAFAPPVHILIFFSQQNGDQSMVPWITDPTELNNFLSPSLWVGYRAHLLGDRLLQMAQALRPGSDGMTTLDQRKMLGREV